MLFQYPEGFWPDSDTELQLPSFAFDAKAPVWGFSTPKGFGPIVTSKAPPIGAPTHQARFSTPRGFGPIVTKSSRLHTVTMSL